LLTPKCDDDEQKQIAKHFDSIDQKIKSTLSKLSIYKNLFKTLLLKLMSGEMRVKSI